MIGMRNEDAVDVIVFSLVTATRELSHDWCRTLAARVYLEYCDDKTTTMATTIR